MAKPTMTTENMDALLNTHALRLPPLSLYIHIPWCILKCPYCDFNSHESHDGIPEEQYIQTLLDDLKSDIKWVQGRKIHSVFIGGGTPSLLSAQSYHALFNELNTLLDFEDHCEITMEANPGTFEAQKFSDYRSAGINRLSIGIQSFYPEHLTVLGRVHDRDQALRAITTAKEAGFKRINLDLMHGLPNQTVEQALDDINTAINFGVSHISWYQLTLEPNTEFHARPPKLPQDETLWDIQEAGQALLTQHGFLNYEISAYAKDGHSARHNINYWQFGDYIGIGAGAHGKITHPKADEIIRTQKWRTPKRYLSAINSYCQQTHTIAKDELAFEAMMNGLRLQEGLPVSYFIERTGMALSEIQTSIDTAKSKGLLEVNSHIVATPKGRLYLNELLELFL